MLHHLQSNARRFLAALGFLSAIVAPPWVPLLMMGLISIRYAAWEIPVIGLLVDLLWLPGSPLSHVPLFTIAGLVLMWGLEPLRSEFLR